MRREQNEQPVNCSAKSPQPECQSKSSSKSLSGGVYMTNIEFAYLVDLNLKVRHFLMLGYPV